MVGLHTVLVGGADISCLVDSVSVSHGRDDPGSQPEASSATITLSVDAATDQLPAALDVGAAVRVTTQTTAGTFDRFLGRVTDIALGWDEAGADTPDAGVGQIVAVSSLADLGRRVVGDEPWPQELDGARVARVMAAAGAPLDPLYSDPGTVQLLPRDVDAQQALGVAQSAAESATGVLWETRTGQVRYADANHRRGAQAEVSLDACDLLVTPTWRRTLEGLINSVSIGYGAEPPEGGEQPRYVASNADSITRWGTYAYSGTTELAALADAQAQGELLLVRNSSPVWVMAALPVDVPGLDATQYDALLGLDIHSLLTLTGLPSLGTAPTSANMWVEGWREELAWGAHQLELVVSGYCRTVPPPRWDDVSPSWQWGGYQTPAPVEQRRNLINNPSAETGPTNWQRWAGTGGTATIAQATGGGAVGAAFMRAAWTVAPTSGGGILWGPLEPVVAGTTYTMSAWCRVSVPVTISVQWQWFADGVATSGSGAAGVAIPANTWTRLPGTATCPAGSNQIQARWYVSGAGLAGSTNATFDLDGALLEAAPTMGTYFDGDTPDASGMGYAWAGAAHASQSIASTAGARRNAFINPAVGTGLGYWAAGTGTGTWATSRETDGALVTDTRAVDTYFRMTCTTPPTSGVWVSTGPVIGQPNFPAMAVTPGAPLVLSAYARSSHADRLANIVVTIHDAAGVSIASGWFVSSAPVVAIGGTTWHRLTATVPALPPGAAYAYMRVYATAAGTNWAAGDTFDATAVLVEASTTVGTYFDGDTPDTTSDDYQWEGTAHASPSSVTPRTLIPGGVPPEMTWDEAACFGPPINIGRWNDQPGTLRWDQIAPAKTWDTYQPTGA